MKKGKRTNDGVIITTDGTFDYYPNQFNRKMITNPERDGARVQTIKTDNIVTVANNKITVTVHPDGAVDIVESE